MRFKSYWSINSICPNVKTARKNSKQSPDSQLTGLISTMTHQLLSLNVKSVEKRSKNMSLNSKMSTGIPRGISVLGTVIPSGRSTPDDSTRRMARKISIPACNAAKSIGLGHLKRRATRVIQVTEITVRGTACRSGERRIPKVTYITGQTGKRRSKRFMRETRFAKFAERMDQMLSSTFIISSLSESLSRMRRQMMTKTWYSSAESIISKLNWGKWPVPIPLLSKWQSTQQRYRNGDIMGNVPWEDY